MESVGIGLYKKESDVSVNPGIFYIKDGGELVSLKQYKKYKLSQVKKNIKIDDFVFLIIRIGDKWSCPEKRQKLVNKLTKKVRVLALNSNFYFPNRPKVLRYARLCCLAQANCQIPLDKPIHLGEASDLEKKDSFRKYKSIYEASRITKICIYKIISRIFSEAKRYKEWYLLKEDVSFVINNTKEKKETVFFKEIIHNVKERYSFLILFVSLHVIPLIFFATSTIMPLHIDQWYITPNTLISYYRPYNEAGIIQAVLPGHLIGSATTPRRSDMGLTAMGSTTPPSSPRFLCSSA